MRSHKAGSSDVRGLTNWFSDHKGACVQACDGSPRTEESESNLRHWIPVIHLTNFLQSIQARSEGLSVTRIISRVPEGER